MTPETPASAGSSSSSPRAWSRGRWIILVLLVFLVHLGLIFAFGNYKEPPPRIARPAEAFNLIDIPDDSLALTDPTLFALPNIDDAASRAWLKTPEIAFAPYRWTEPPRLLPLRPAELGNAGGWFVSTNAFARVRFAEKPAPESSLAGSFAPITPSATNSTFRITGALAQRAWLNAPALLSWTNIDLLTNTVVQALVQPDGSVFSATLLVPPGPGTNEQHAAEYALALIRNAQFATIREPGMMMGNLIFEWHVLPP